MRLFTFSALVAIAVIILSAAPRRSQACTEGQLCAVCSVPPFPCVQVSCNCFCDLTLGNCIPVTFGFPDPPFDPCLKKRNAPDHQQNVTVAKPRQSQQLLPRGCTYKEEDSRVVTCDALSFTYDAARMPLQPRPYPAELRVPLT